jgi:Cu/Ag efflux protein CusF
MNLAFSVLGAPSAFPSRRCPGFDLIGAASLTPSALAVGAQSATPADQASYHPTTTSTGKVTLRQGRVEGLDMPGMKIVFWATDPSLLNGLNEGDKERFSAGLANGTRTVSTIERAEQFGQGVSMHISFVLRAVALAAALIAAPARAAPLSLDAALDLAVQRSESAHSARAGAASAGEMARAAGQLPDPMLNVGVENVPVTGSDHFSTAREPMTQKVVGISQEWVSHEKRSARQAAAQAAVTREMAQAQAVVADTRLQTAKAYLDAYYAAEALKLTIANEHHAHEELAASRARLASSTGASQDVLALTAALGRRVRGNCAATKCCQSGAATLDWCAGR